MTFEMRHKAKKKAQDWRAVLKLVLRGGGGHVSLFRLSFELPNRQPGKGYLYRQLSVGFSRHLLRWHRERRRWVAYFLFLRLRGSSVYGGRLAD